MIKFVRDDGKEMELDKQYRILSIEGLGDVSQEIFTEKKAIGDGDVITGKRLGSRTITISACNDYAGPNDSSRRAINDYFNPKNSFKIYITYKGVCVWCECEIDTKDLPTANIYEPQQFVIAVYCPSPYLKSNDNFGKNIAEITPMMGFPLLIPINKGFVASARNFSRRVFIQNDGAVDTYCKAVITTTAEIANFKLFKNDKEYILIPERITADDVVEIDFEQRLLIKNGKKALPLLDKTSTFFSIDRGGCYLGYASDLNENAVNVTIYYNQLYLGVD